MSLNRQPPASFKKTPPAAQKKGARAPVKKNIPPPHKKISLRDKKNGLRKIFGVQTNLKLVNHQEYPQYSCHKIEKHCFSPVTEVLRILNGGEAPF